MTNYKRTPTEIAGRTHRQFQYFKDQAIDEIATGLRAQFTPEGVATKSTFVPMPSSKTVGDADFCDRLNITLHRAFCKPACNSDQVRGVTGVQN